MLAIRGHRVACIDYDLEAGGLHVVFGLPASELKYTVLHLLSTVAPPRINQVCQDLTTALVQRRNDGALFLFPTFAEANRLARAIQPDRNLDTVFESIVNQIESDYKPDYVLVDTRAGFTEIASGPLLVNDALVVVARPNKQNVEGLALFMDIMRLRRNPPQTVVVLNQVPDTRAARPLVKAILHKLAKRSVSVSIPYDPDLAVDEHIISIKRPDSPLLVHYARLVKWIENLF